MTATAIEKHKLLISFLGKEKVLELYRLLGNERISFATLKHYITLEKMASEVNGKQSINEVAKECGVHRTTIYRQLKRKSTALKIVI